MIAVARSKTLATWLALIGGGLGLHRFYLHGPRDSWGWLLVAPTLLGFYGIARMREFGADDHLAWALIPFLGGALAAAMLGAVVIGLTPDDRWAARYGSPGEPVPSGWPNILGVAVALFIGAGVLMATIAFSAQRYFEYQAEQAAQAKSSAPTQ